ncbi:MAG: glycoside hydrolase family 88 protein [Candidatus Marinimicrobia bacterium]|nr:glycoside hydrolase family 88 protein [Candidatus Neomarinimicrobiota bacterium]MCF7827397.1 glycoside hydrolase family 88 protein [Candidatus Neomarinimicrobiota bacterium]MCF7881370.1 glycoside hydrolase family 88 protein [Candidatus Neomarinimicrobiota bacterium]
MALAQNIVDESLPWSERMAQSEMFRRGAYSLEGDGEFNITHIGSLDDWSYSAALLMQSIERVGRKTGNDMYFNYMKRYVDQFVEQDGDIRRYSIEEYNIDNVNPGKLLLTLYEETGHEKYRLAAETIREQLKGHPRTDAGGYWHKRIYPDQMWLDGIYMWTPFAARYAKMFEEPALFDDLTEQIILIEKKTRDKETGLLYHAWNEDRSMDWADEETGLSPHFWGRAIGWYAMAIVDVLDYLPKDHENRQELINILQRLTVALLEVQDPETGVWFQILDMPGKEGNYSEASASSMFTYAMLKGINKGYLDKKHLPKVKKAYQGLLDQFVTVDGAGLVNLNMVCTGAGLGGDPYRDGSFEYYVSEDIGTNALNGGGPFIIASLEMEKAK